MFVAMLYRAMIELPTVKLGVVEATRATCTGAPEGAVPKLAIGMVGSMVSPGDRVAGTSRRWPAARAGPGWPRCTVTGWLMSLCVLDSRTEPLELTIRWT